MFATDIGETRAYIFMANTKYLEISMYLPLRWGVLVEDYITTMSRTGPYMILVDAKVRKYVCNRYK